MSSESQCGHPSNLCINSSDAWLCRWCFNHTTVLPRALYFILNDVSLVKAWKKFAYFITTYGFLHDNKRYIISCIRENATEIWRRGRDIWNEKLSLGRFGRFKKSTVTRTTSGYGKPPIPKLWIQEEETVVNDLEVLQILHKLGRPAFMFLATDTGRRTI